MECILYADICSNMMQANSDIRAIILSPTPLNCLEWRPVDTPWFANLVVVNEIGANGVSQRLGGWPMVLVHLPLDITPMAPFWQPMEFGMWLTE